ncbi:YitT family protein [Aliiglaciecola sp. LCG003]|uniref:YitT family protein n=1 Tax=Aliiglaciecola sp. LCG003 TaxID=3053655 RepID=UPI0025725B52|nr:YitT family protein [Aliiglaciecola sp. LCG003]WJG09070.1 YitT family protein [Aliiglaciecola sp. LCG003]
MPFPTHRFYEDVLALFCACTMVSLGIVLFDHQGMLTGGTAGIAIIGSHLTSVNFGIMFFVVNIPFYYLAWSQLSKRFTINTFISVTMVSLMTEQMSQVIQIQQVHPLFSAMVGGMLIGVGLLIMFRHKSSLGGLGILALYLQNKYTIRAGNFGLLVDSIIMTGSIFIFSFELVMLSVIGAITLNLLIAVNHKPGRYQAGNVKKPLDVKSDEVQADIDDSLLNTAK